MRAPRRLAQHLVMALAAGAAVWAGCVAEYAGPLDDRDSSAASGPPVLYLNFGGVTLWPGRFPDAPSDVSDCVSSATAIAPSDLDASDIADITQLVQELFVEFGVQVVQQRPASGPYTMAVVTRYGLAGMPPGALGYAPKDCGNVNPNDVALVFTSPAVWFEKTTIAHSIAHEVGHTYGLDHIDSWRAIMAPEGGGLLEPAADWSRGPSVSAVQCTRGEQDDRLVLHRNLAPRRYFVLGEVLRPDGSLERPYVSLGADGTIFTILAPTLVLTDADLGTAPVVDDLQKAGGVLEDNVFVYTPEGSIVARDDGGTTVILYELVGPFALQALP